MRDHLGPEVAADDVAAERQRQAAGPLRPPLAEVDDLLQALVLIRQLPFVDEQPGLGLAIEDGLLNLVERNHDVLEVGLVEPQRQVRGRQRPRNRDAAPLDGRRSAGLRDDDRAVVVAHAGAVRQQRVLVGEVRVGVKRDGGDFVRAVERGAIQRLDVGQHLLDDEPAGIDGAARQAEEHERIVGIGAVGDGDSV